MKSGLRAAVKCVGDTIDAVLPPHPWESVKKGNASAALTATATTAWPEAEYRVVNADNCVVVAFVALKDKDTQLFDTAVHHFSEWLLRSASPNAVKAPTKLKYAGALAGAATFAAQNSQCLWEQCRHAVTSPTAVLLVLAAFQTGTQWSYGDSAATALQCLFRGVALTPNHITSVFTAMLVEGQLPANLACKIVLDITADTALDDRTQLLSQALRSVHKGVSLTDDDDHSAEHAAIPPESYDIDSVGHETLGTAEQPAADDFEFGWDTDPSVPNQANISPSVRTLRARPNEAVLPEMLKLVSTGQDTFSLFMALYRCMPGFRTFFSRPAAEAVAPTSQAGLDRLQEMFEAGYDDESFKAIVDSVMQHTLPRNTWIQIANSTWASKYDVSSCAFEKAVFAKPFVPSTDYLVATARSVPRGVRLGPEQVQRVAQLWSSHYTIVNADLVHDGVLTLLGQIVAHHFEHADCDPKHVEEHWAYAAQAHTRQEVWALFLWYWSAATAVRSSPYRLSSVLVDNITASRQQLTRAEDAAIHETGPYSILKAAVQEYGERVRQNIDGQSVAGISCLVEPDGEWWLVKRFTPEVADEHLVDDLLTHGDKINSAITALWRQVGRAAALQKLILSDRVVELGNGTLGERQAEVAQFARERSQLASLRSIEERTADLQQSLDYMIGAGECVLHIPEPCCDATLPEATCSRVAAEFFAMALRERDSLFGAGVLSVDDVAKLVREMAQLTKSTLGAGSQPQKMLDVEDRLRDALGGVDLGQEQALIGQLVPDGVDLRHILEKMSAAGTARALQSIVAQLWPTASADNGLQRIGHSVAAVRLDDPLTAAVLAAAPLVEVLKALADAAPLRALITRPLAGDSSIDGMVLNDGILGTVIAEMKNHEGRVSVRDALEVLRGDLSIFQALAPESPPTNFEAFLLASATTVGSLAPAGLASRIAKINTLCDRLLTAVATLGKPHGTEHTRVCLTTLNDPAAAIQLQLQMSPVGLPELSLRKGDLSLWEDFAGPQLQEFAANTRLLASLEHDDSEAFLSCLAHAEAMKLELRRAQDSGLPSASQACHQWPAAVAVSEATSQCELDAFRHDLSEWVGALAAAEGRHPCLTLLPVPLRSELLTAPDTSHIPHIGCALGLAATAREDGSVQSFSAHTAAAVAEVHAAAFPRALDCLAQAVEDVFVVDMDRVLIPPPAVPGSTRSWQRSCVANDEAAVANALLSWFPSRPPLPVECLYCTQELRPQTVADYLRRVTLLPGLRFAVVHPERLAPKTASRFATDLSVLRHNPAPKAPLLEIHSSSYHTAGESFSPSGARPALRIARLDVFSGRFGCGKTTALRKKLAKPARFAVLEPADGSTNIQLDIPHDLLSTVADRDDDAYDTAFDVSFHAMTDASGRECITRASAVDLTIAQLAHWGYLTTAHGGVVLASCNLRVAVEVHAESEADARRLLPLLFAAADSVTVPTLDVDTLELWDRDVDFTKIRVRGELLNWDLCRALGPCFVAACITMYNCVVGVDTADPIKTLNPLLRDRDGKHDTDAVRAVLRRAFETTDTPGWLPRIIRVLSHLLIAPVLSPWRGSEIDLKTMAAHLVTPNALLVTPGFDPVCVVTSSARILRLDRPLVELQATEVYRDFVKDLPAGNDQVLWAAFLYKALAPSDESLLQGATAFADIAAKRRFVLSHALVGRIIPFLHLCARNCASVLSSPTGSGKTAMLAYISECMAYAKRRTLQAELLLHKGEHHPTTQEELCAAVKAVQGALPCLALPDPPTDIGGDPDTVEQALQDVWLSYGLSSTDGTVAFAEKIESARRRRAEREKHDCVEPFFFRMTVRPGHTAQEALQDFEEFLDLAESAEGRPLQFLLFLDEINTADDLAEMEACLRDGILCRRVLPPNVVVVGAINPLKDTAAPLGQDEQHYIVREISPSLRARVLRFPQLRSQEREQLLQGMPREDIPYPQFTTLLSEPHAAAMRCSKAPIRSQRSLIRAVAFQKPLLYLLRVADYTDGRTCYNDRHHHIRATIASAMINFALQFRGDDRRLVEDALTNAYVSLGLREELQLDSPMAVFREVLDKVVNQAHIDAPGLTFSETMQQMLLLLLVIVVADRPMTGMLQGIPGCGKTTAVRVIEASMQGSGSTTAFFRNINVVLRVHWQLCHTYTTAAQLRGSFERHRETETTPLIAPGLHDNVERAAVERTLLMIDESTHALRAPKTNKALHEPIDSGWDRCILAGNEELDDANRDRTVLQRISENDAHQIRERALGALAPTDNNRENANRLVAWLLSNETCNRHFGGKLPDQRDVQSTLHRVQYTDMTAKGNNVTPETVFVCFEENFGRATDLEGLCRGAVACLSAEPDEWELRPRLQCFSVAMSRQRPQRQPPHLWPRNKLVVLPDSSESQLAQVIKVASDASAAASPGRTTKVIRVSEFPGDKRAMGLAHVVHAVRHSAEQGHHVVLVNGLPVLQSFFDLLVRSFAGVVEGRSTVKIALSTFTVEVVAHPNFAMTVILPQEVLNAPPSEVRAFMSRMEVYRLPTLETPVSEEVLQSAQRFVATVGRQSFVGGMSDVALRATAAAAVASKLAVEPTASVHDQIVAVVCRLLNVVPSHAAILMLTASRFIGQDPDVYREAYFVTQQHFASLEAALDACPNSRHLLAFTHDCFGAAAAASRPLRRCATLTAAEYSSRTRFLAALDKVKAAEMIAVFVHGGPTNTMLINEIKAALEEMDTKAKRAVVVMCGSSGIEYPTSQCAAWEALYIDTVAPPAQQIRHAIARHLGNAACSDNGASLSSLLRRSVERFQPQLSQEELPHFLSGDDG